MAKREVADKGPSPISARLEGRHGFLKQEGQCDPTLAGQTAIVTTRNDRIITFFLKEFCPLLGDVFNKNVKTGLDERSKIAIRDYINWTRNRAATVGDRFVRQIFLGDVPTHKRITQIYTVFNKWCAVDGQGGRAECTRESYCEKLRELNNLSVMSYRRNAYLARDDIDIRTLESDIKYIEAVRSLGVTALSSAMDSLIGEIFGNAKRIR